MASDSEDKTSRQEETPERQQGSVPTNVEVFANQVRRIRAAQKAVQTGYLEWVPQEEFTAPKWESIVQGYGNVFTSLTAAVSGRVEAKEHEKTREFISEKIADLANKQDIIESKEEIIRALNGQITDLNARLEAAMEKLAKTQELEAAATRVCDEVRWQSEESRRQMGEQLADLRKYLSKFAPHKRFFKVTFGFLLFFSAAMFINAVFGIRIIEPFWGAIGIALTAAMLVVIYFGMKDTQQSDDRPEKS